jgi:uncharacterized protein YxjI
MFQYPLTLSFSAFAVSPRIEVKDASGRPVLSASKKLLSSKDEIDILAGSQPAFKVMSQENRITDIPSNWDVTGADGKIIGVVDDDFMTALDGMKVTQNTALNDFLQMQAHRALGLRSVKMYWLKDTAGKQIGFVAPDQRSLAIEQLPLYQITRQLPFSTRLITPQYAIQLGGKLVMNLKKERTLFIDRYTLRAVDQISEADERFLIPSVLLTIVYERQRLKDLYS